MGQPETYLLNIMTETFASGLRDFVPPIQCASLEEAQRRTRELCVDLNASGLRMTAAIVIVPDGQWIEVGPLHPYA